MTEKGTAAVTLGGSAVWELVWPRALEQALPVTPLPSSVAGGRSHSAAQSLSTGKVMIAHFTREG